MHFFVKISTHYPDKTRTLIDIIPPKYPTRFYTAVNAPSVCSVYMYEGPILYFTTSSPGGSIVYLELPNHKTRAACRHASRQTPSLRLENKRRSLTRLVVIQLE